MWERACLTITTSCAWKGWQKRANVKAGMGSQNTFLGHLFLIPPLITGPFDLAGSNSNGRKHFYSAFYVPGTILSTLHTINAFNSSLSLFEEGSIIISILQIQKLRHGEAVFWSSLVTRWPLLQYFATFFCVQTLWCGRVYAWMITAQYPDMLFLFMPHLPSSARVPEGQTLPLHLCIPKAPWCV